MKMDLATVRKNLRRQMRKLNLQSQSDFAALALLVRHNSIALCPVCSWQVLAHGHHVFPAALPAHSGSMNKT